VDHRVVERIGYLPEERGLYRKMQVRDARGRALASGTYLCRLRSEDQAATRKMLLLR